MNRLSLATAHHWLFFCIVSALIQQCEGRTISEMSRLSSSSSALSLLFCTAVFQLCDARTNPSSIMLPNIGPDTDYTVWILQKQHWHAALLWSTQYGSHMPITFAQLSDLYNNSTIRCEISFLSVSLFIHLFILFRWLVLTSIQPWRGQSSFTP